MASARGDNENRRNQMLQFSFDLPEESLIWVDRHEHLQRMAEVLSNSILMGIDTETKPNFLPKHLRTGPPDRTALVQIASRGSDFTETVFIVDMLTLSRKQSLLTMLNDALSKQLSQEKCLKLGQGLKADLRELSQFYPTMTCFNNVNGVLETFALLKFLKPQITQQMSLKNLTIEYLHCNLSKSQQLSDWSRRPLNRSQLHYAACDALVLLRLFDTMCADIPQRLRTTTSVRKSSSTKQHSKKGDGKKDKDVPITQEDIRCTLHSLAVSVVFQTTANTGTSSTRTSTVLGNRHHQHGSTSWSGSSSSRTVSTASSLTTNSVIVSSTNAQHHKSSMASKRKRSFDGDTALVSDKKRNNNERDKPTIQNNNIKANYSSSSSATRMKKKRKLTQL